MASADPYLPIADYGAIGNLHTVALVGLDGSIDWCCFPEIDSPSAFAALLDHRRGGRFQVVPHRPLTRRQCYLKHTNVLETTFDTEGGRLCVTDFMPLRGSINGSGPLEAPPEIHRLLHAEGGDVEVDVTWAPRFDYAREAPRIERTPDGFVAHAGTRCMALGGLPVRGNVATDIGGRLVRARFTLAAGHRIALVTRWGTADSTAPLSRSVRALDDTLDSWHAWVRKEEATGDRTWAGYWNEHVIRSELALKLMTFAPTGAIAAAPTTSLPEGIGGVRNWDYRYTWIRDAAMAAQALFALGHGEEAVAFVDWVERVAREREDEWGLRIMYDVRGGYCLPETELTHLEGYRGSRPVRIGNEASEQLQLDVFGELVSSAYELARLGHDLDEDIKRFLPHVVDRAHDAWHRPDYGIWEMRNGPKHFVYSKAMVWMALDRATRLVAEGHLTGDSALWHATQQQIRAEVLEKGFDPDLGAFVMAYDTHELDAANLLLPFLEFLPFEDPRVQGTIDRTLERLTVNDLVYRYHAEDGLPGQEGAFVFCTFWLVDALALSGRLDEAYRIFEGVTGRANHLGLLSEQIDPHSGTLLGNFPQAFSHIGLINSALYLAYMEGRETPVPIPIGSPEHRAEVERPA